MSGTCSSGASLLSSFPPDALVDDRPHNTTFILNIQGLTTLKAWKSLAPAPRHMYPELGFVPRRRAVPPPAPPPPPPPISDVGGSGVWSRGSSRCPGRPAIKIVRASLSCHTSRAHHPLNPRTRNSIKALIGSDNQETNVIRELGGMGGFVESPVCWKWAACFPA